MSEPQRQRLFFCGFKPFYRDKLFLCACFRRALQTRAKEAASVEEDLQTSVSMATGAGAAGAGAPAGTPPAPPPQARQNQPDFPEEAKVIYNSIRGYKSHVTRAKNALEEMCRLVDANPSNDGRQMLRAKLDTFQEKVDNYRARMEELEDADSVSAVTQRYWRTVQKNYLEDEVLPQQDRALRVIVKVNEYLKPAVAAVTTGSIL